MNNGLPSPLKMALPPGASSPGQAAIYTQENSAIAQAKLANISNGGRKKKFKYGGGDIPVSTITPIYRNTMGGPQAPGSQQIANAQTINQSIVQASQDKVPLVTGGKKRRQRKTRKTRRKMRKSRRKM